MRTREEYLRNALRVGDAHPFIIGCRLAGVEPTARQAGHWMAGWGRALEAAWERWPKSKNLPRLAEVSQ